MLLHSLCSLSPSVSPYLCLSLPLSPSVSLPLSLSVCVSLQTPEEYSLMWILTDVSSTFLITAVFIFHWCAHIRAHT